MIFLNKNNQSGMMLMNVMISLGIMALLLTISIPFFQAYQPGLKLSASGRELIADLRLAQQLAIAEQKNHGIYFDESADYYSLFRFEETATTTLKTVYLDDMLEFKDLIGFSDKAVIFNPYGAVKDSGSISIFNISDKVVIVEVKNSGFVNLISQ